MKFVFAKLCRSGETSVIGEAWQKLSNTKDHHFHASIALLQRFGYLEKIQTQAGRGVRILKPHDTALRGLNFEELEARRQFEYKKFGVMLNYASRFRKHCYRSFILSYFGEWTRSRDCANCSRCNPKKYPKVVHQAQESKANVKKPVATIRGSDDSTIVTLKILSCVLRVQQKLGREKVAKILAGSEDASVQEYRSLSTYGLLSSYSIKTVTDMIDFLIAGNYIAQESGYRPSIYVTAKGQAFLKERPNIEIPGVVS